MIACARDPEVAYCWRCGAWLPDWGNSNSFSNGDGHDGGWGDGLGYGDGDGYGYGYGNGGGNGYSNSDDLPLCTDSLACAVRQASRPE
ncbi:MAG: hypothetical protein UY96_C0017G0014 [Parcubacteria group bacterium GW2011_GWB1_56_8]|nr:MAG: hypothetical protein UY96_C0017G0014 [Parcubacteria group bacterium GW2011_GWB1_56_8]